MKKVVRSVARFLLWIVTGAVPFVIAACYGVMYSFSRSGRVVDAVTHQGIEGIQVTCRIGGMSGSVTSSWTDGNFLLDYDQPCDEVQFVDVDGAANGSYQATTVPFPASGDLLVEMTPEP
jgi:hypothetical protein